MSGLKKILGTLLQIAFVAIGTALGGPLGGFIGSLIGSLVSNLFFSEKSNRSGTKQEIGKVNVRVEEPIRWIVSGQTKVGGGVLFGEFDDDGNLWYLVVHCDSILHERLEYYLDSIPVTVDEDGEVLTKDFRLTSDGNKNLVENDGEGDTYITIWTTTYSESDPTPPAISQLAATFPTEWTADHKLVGTTYSVIKISAVNIEHRHKIYKWRGPIGLGEPSVSIVGKWGREYDPREVGHDLNDPTTYEFSRNAVLKWAWFRTHRYGRNKSKTSINWDRVAEQADICDQIVSGDYGSHVRYRCDISIPEDQARSDAEQQILLTMDGQLVFDDDGKCWPRVGYFYEPTLRLTRNRDIVAMESKEAQDGESETQGVVVRYTDPDALYTVQTSAPWYNPLYYTVGEAATFLRVDAIGIQDHNQAMRIAKAVGLRVQSAYRLAPTCGLRGIKATQERILNLLYDNTFSGDHEIVSQVEFDKSGQLCRMGLVPVDANRWTLLAGEEKAKPVINSDLIGAGAGLATGVVVTPKDGRLEVTFDLPTRSDVIYEFQYVKTSDLPTENWLDMTVQTFNQFAYSEAVQDQIQYSIRYRTVLPSGRSTSYSSHVTSTPGVVVKAVTNFTATGGENQADLAWKNSTDLDFSYNDIFRNTVNDFDTSTEIVSAMAGTAGANQTYNDTPLISNTYYYWIISYNDDNVASSLAGPKSAIVTDGAA